MRRLSLTLLFLATILCATLAQQKYSFRGKLDGRILFRLDLQQNKDGIVAGETTYYRKNGQIAKLPVVGWYRQPTQQMIDNGYDVISIDVFEYDGTKQCGYFSIELKNGDVAGGYWSHNDKHFDISDIEKTQFPAGTKFFSPVTGPAIRGEYSYSYKPTHGLYEWGGSCVLTYNNGKVHFEIGNVTPNIAEDKGVATLTGSYFTAVHQGFRYKAYIDRRFVCIWSINDDYVEVDDWGANATVEGVYIKSSNW